MSLFFLGNNFCKNKKTFKIFSPQLLEVYRILLVETTLESIMFYYTFSVINTMFIPCTTLLYNSTAATRTLKLSTTLLSICFGIHLISLHFSFGILSCLWIVFTNSVFQLPRQKLVRRVEILWIKWPGQELPVWCKIVSPMGSYASGIHVFKLDATYFLEQNAWIPQT